MKTILTPLQMKHADEYAIKRLHIPSLRLMERAGMSVVNEIELRFRRNKKRLTTVLLFCGKGNNGGDGFVVARQLTEINYRVTVVLIEKAAELQGDAKVNYEKLQDYKLTELETLGYPAFRELRKKKYDIIVDAMLGTSFQGKLQGSYLSVVRWCNKQPGLKVAVDIPTGMDGETGVVGSDAFRADCTVTMSNAKTGFYLQRAKEYTGDVVVAEIGIPKKALPQGSLKLVDRSDVSSSFPKRPANSHKHSVGKVFVLAGSKSMTGAALLCSQSAMRSGAGQVILGIPESEYEIVAKRSREVMAVGLPGTRQGSISQLAMGEIERRIEWSDVFLIGCGMSRNNETLQLIRDIIRTSKKPIVIDADALNALIGNLSVLVKRKHRGIILTPHHGEFSRLTGISSSEIGKNIFFSASQFAKKYRCTVILKGAPSVTASPDGTVYVNPTGNPGMSTAGSGDVLAGITAALIGQGNQTTNGAINAAYIHGAAGDRAAASIGMYGMIAGDILNEIPAAIKDVMEQ